MLIETILAAFEMDEILYELRDHVGRAERRPLGLHLQRHQEVRAAARSSCLADRAQVTMTVPFMRAYTELLVKTCHRGGAHAIGGMAAFIPVKDARSTSEAFAKVKADKEREAATASTARGWRTPGWCRSPGGLHRLRPAPNQLATKKREDVHMTAADLLNLG